MQGRCGKGKVERDGSLKNHGRAHWVAAVKEDAVKSVCRQQQLSVPAVPEVLLALAGRGSQER